jgi:CheY-like chemotaxis protein
MDAKTTASPASQPGIILLYAAIEDHRTELAKVLAAAGHRCLFPPTIEEAAARAASGDLLIACATMLGEREITLLDTVRNSETAWHIPVIILADVATIDQSNRCLDYGAVDCLTWPVLPERLLSRVHSCVARKRRMDAETLGRVAALKDKARSENLVNSIIPIAESMIGVEDPVKILEQVLTEAMRITDCEGGTIYMRGDDDTLRFVLVRNDRLDINMGGSVGKPISFKPLSLTDAEGKPNHKFIAGHAALTGNIVSIPDAYEAGRFDFSGTRKFDETTGYRSKSFLTIPLRNPRGFVTGVLQLINSRDPRAGVVVPFDSALQPTIEALALLATAVMQAYREKQGQKRTH